MTTLGLLRIKVLRGINLVVQDIIASDPYVIVTMGNQKVKTRFIHNNCNPQWDEELTLAINDTNLLPIILAVWDKDTLTGDDKMGDAEIDIKPYIKMMMKLLDDDDQELFREEGRVVGIVEANKKMNCLVEESCIFWKNGKMIQEMHLELRNVKSGQVQIQIEWINNPLHSKLPTFV
ncbi:protein C2-DOMAIN ABA-RELATED 8-like [Impatiens glandulifera]|uniref:protein C2-DOMAIN ABA-RELATED 8-like n=1 Tax=Impatiens glandulifera TaxID=253017 RepID=UPI001FB0AA27|nr:protein C2-DOMAIN ABA-RELATED 8-like [Impatiens glandulifera]